jgi:uncharacterized membrane protein
MGIAIAFYHAYDEITFTFGACYISPGLNCGTVLGSGYTTFLNVQFWVYGVVWFPVCLLVGLWVIRRHGSPLGSILVPFLMIGNIFTLVPWNIEIRILGGEYCPVCITMYVVNYLLTFIALTSRSRETQGKEPLSDGAGGGTGTGAASSVSR